MEIQINKKNIKKRLNTDTDIGGVCGGDVGTILVTEFVLYFSLSKQYPDKQNVSTNKQTSYFWLDILVRVSDSSILNFKVVILLFLFTSIGPFGNYCCFYMLWQTEIDNKHGLLHYCQVRKN